MNPHLKQCRFWCELVGDTNRRCQRAVKATEPPKLAGMKARAEWTQAGGGEDLGGPGQMVLPLIQVQGRKKKEIPGSRQPLQRQQTTRRESSKAPRGSRDGAAGAGKRCGLTEARAPGLAKTKRFFSSQARSGRPAKATLGLHQAPGCSSEVDPWNRVSSSEAWKIFPVLCPCHAGLRIWPRHRLQSTDPLQTHQTTYVLLGGFRHSCSTRDKSGLQPAAGELGGSGSTRRTRGCSDGETILGNV